LLPLAEELTVVLLNSNGHSRLSEVWFLLDYSKSCSNLPQ